MKAKTAPKIESTETLTQISIRLPKKMLAEIDERAKKESRARSNWIMLALQASLDKPAE